MVRSLKKAIRKSQKRAQYVKETEASNKRKKDKEAIVDAVKKKRAKRLLFGADIDSWVPKTELGKKVKNGEIKDLDEIFDKNLKIKEPEIVDFLIKDVKEKLMDTRKTSYVRMSGRKYDYRCAVLMGDGHKFLGFGVANDKDRWTAAAKAARLSRLNLIRVKKGCGSWECLCGTEHSVPFNVEGKTCSVKVTLMPAPLGTGLVVSEVLKPVFRFCGIKDVWSRSIGQTSTRINMISAALDALQKTYKDYRE